MCTHNEVGDRTVWGLGLDGGVGLGCVVLRLNNCIYRPIDEYEYAIRIHDTFVGKVFQIVLGTISFEVSLILSSWTKSSTEV